MTSRLTQERGAAGIEAVLILPVLILMLALALYAGRVSGSEGHVQDAAQAGARAASLARTPEGAVARASAAAESALPTGSVYCESPDIGVDVSQWFDPGYVTVTVRCGIRTDGFAVLGALPTNDIEVSWTEAIDPARLALDAQ